MIVRVEWSNKDHELLSNVDAGPGVLVSAGGMDIPPRGAPQPFPEYEIPPGYQTLEVEFAVLGRPLPTPPQNRPWRRYCGDFSKARLPAMRPEMPVLLWARQEFRILKSGDTPLEPVGTMHPLMTCMPGGSPDGSAVRLHVWTDFLDVTDYVFQLEMNRTAVETYLKAHQRENAADPANPVHLAALAFTGGKPKVWFASYCESRVADLPGPEAGAFVFYRPATDGYSKACAAQSGMIYRMGRYCLAPSRVEFEEGNDEASDQMVVKPIENNMVAIRGWCLRVGMDEALRRSGKRVVMLTPYPHAHDFGMVVGKEMPNLTDMALRFLHGNGEIGRNQPSLTLGRLAVGAYSAGGRPLAQMFKQCRHRIAEAYLFDPTGIIGCADQVIHWAWSTPDARLRISMGWNEKPLNSIYLNSLGFIRSKGAQGLPVNSPDNITAWPQFANAPEFLEAYNRNEWWQYVTKHIPATKYPIPRDIAGDFRHQFAMYAGEQRPVTFFEQWLRQSGF